MKQRITRDVLFLVCGCIPVLLNFHITLIFYVAFNSFNPSNVIAEIQCSTYACFKNEENKPHERDRQDRTT